MSNDPSDPVVRRRARSKTADVVETILRPSPERAAWLLETLRPAAPTASLRRLIPLLSLDDPVIVQLTLRLLRVCRRDRRILADGIARELPRLCAESEAGARALEAIHSLHPAAHISTFLEYADHDNLGAAAAAIEFLVYLGAFTRDHARRNVEDQKVASAVLAGCIRTGESELVHTHVERLLAPGDSESSVYSLECALNIAGVPEEFRDEAAYRLGFEKPFSRGATRRRSPFLVPELNRAARDRAHALLSHGQTTKIEERFASDPVGAISLVRDLTVAAAQLVSEEERDFAPLALGLSAFLDAVASGAESQSPDDIETLGILSYAILAKVIRGGPVDLHDPTHSRSFTTSELRWISQQDEPWWQSDLWEQMARRVPVDHWKVLADASEFFVSWNARAVLLALDSESPYGIWVVEELGVAGQEETIERFTRVGGTNILRALGFHHDESRTTDSVRGFVISARVLGPEAKDLVDAFVTCEAPVLADSALLALAILCKSEQAALAYLRDSGGGEMLQVPTELLGESFDLDALRAQARQEWRPASPSSPLVVNSAPRLKSDRVGRNDPCPCGSGRKYKKCCLNVT